MKSLHVLYIKRILPNSISAPAPHLKAHLEMAASHFMMCADGNLFYGTNLARGEKELDYKRVFWNPLARISFYEFLLRLRESLIKFRPSHCSGQSPVIQKVKLNLF